jgi:hypothetical protein
MPNITTSAGTLCTLPVKKAQADGDEQNPEQHEAGQVDYRLAVGEQPEQHAEQDERIKPM